MPALQDDQCTYDNQVRLQAVKNKLALVTALYSLSLVACAPKIVKEPYPVEVVREVVVPIPREYTRELATPELADCPCTGRDLADLIEAWKAWGKTANEHRAKVRDLSKGQ